MSFSALMTVYACLSSMPEQLVVDTHVHLTMAYSANPIFHGVPGDGVTKSPRWRWFNQVDAEHLLNSKTQLLVASLWPPFRGRPGRYGVDDALDQMHKLVEFVRKSPAFVIAKTPAQARALVAQGRIALIPAVEGGEGIESTTDVDRLYAAGVRSITLAHLSDNAMGGSSQGQALYNLFGVKADHLNPRGLSPLGKETVKRMMDLGMLIDLSHASDVMTDEVLAMAKERSVPVFVSHTGARTFASVERNVSDSTARRIAELGGMLGITLADNLISEVPERARWPGYRAGTCNDVVAHWKHLATITSEKHINLGSDFNGTIARARPGGLCPNGLRNTSDLPTLFEALKSQGIPSESVSMSGFRFLEMWEAVDAKASPAAQMQAMDADVTVRSPLDIGL